MGSERVAIPAIDCLVPDGYLRCSNCGCIVDTPHVGMSLYDGEACCSEACVDEHDEKGCPFKHGLRYRDCPHPPNVPGSCPEYGLQLSLDCGVEGQWCQHCGYRRFAARRTPTDPDTEG